MMYIICNRLLNEVMNLRCVRMDGHSGSCSYKNIDGPGHEDPVDWEKVFPKDTSKKV